MATHKPATAVVIAPVAEKSGLALWVERYWKLAVAVGLAVTGWVLYSQHRARTQRDEADQSWEKVLSVATEDPLSRAMQGPPTELLAIAEQVRGQQAGAWALYLAAASAADEGDAEAARLALERLKAEYPDHALLVRKLAFPGHDSPVPAADALAARVAGIAAWKAARPELFANPEPAADAPRAVLHTDLGDIQVALYREQAPQHVENFLKLAREGYYNGTRFHRVIPGFMIQGGDPNTIQGEPATWGQGGPDYKVPKETNELRHFAGVLAAAKQPGQTDSSGSQFYITVGTPHHLDGEHVVFGKVTSGMDVVRAIEKTPLDPLARDRPAAPPTLRSVEVLTAQ
jgi:cyclophilin family peptidyl-prolyl cis-trans isomerase